MHTFARLFLAVLTLLTLSAPALAQQKTVVRVPDLSVFDDGMEMIGALAAMGLKGRISEMPAPSVDLEGKLGQLPAAGTMLPQGSEVIIFRYGKYVTPEESTTGTSTTGQVSSGLEGVVAGPEVEFVGTYAGTMTSEGTETPITVEISNQGNWSLMVETPAGVIGGRSGNGEVTEMRDGMLTYRLEGGSYQSVLSIKVSADELVGSMVTILGTGDAARRTEATLRATRVKG